MAASVASVLSSSIVATAPASSSSSSSSSSSYSPRASPCAASLPSETLSIGLTVRKPLQGECFRSNVARTGSLKFKPLPIRAASSEETTTDASKQVEDLFADLKEKWDGVENKSTVLLYGGGAILALWLSSTIVGAVNSVPLLPKILELVGLGYTGWFTYRYLLFKSSRKELVADIEELKKKITGATEE